PKQVSTVTKQVSKKRKNDDQLEIPAKPSKNQKVINDPAQGLNPSISSQNIQNIVGEDSNPLNLPDNIQNITGEDSHANTSDKELTKKRKLSGSSPVKISKIQKVARDSSLISSENIHNIVEEDSNPSTLPEIIQNTADVSNIVNLPENTQTREKTREN